MFLLFLKVELFSLFLQEKYHLRLKVLEESVRGSPNSNTRSTPEGRSVSNGPSRRQSLGGADNISKLTSNGFVSKRTPTSQLRPSSLSSSTSAVLRHAKGTSKSFDGGTRSLDRGKILLNGRSPNYTFNQSCEGTKDGETNNNWKGSSDDKPNEFQAVDTEDNVPGVLYDLLQKEVVALRKAGHEKDQSLKDKDDAIEVDFLPNCFIILFWEHFKLKFSFDWCFSDVSKKSRDVDQGNGSWSEEDEKRSSCHGKGGSCHACRERTWE